MSQNSSPDDVPGAKQGTADSLAAPGRVGAGGTISRLKARWRKEWAEIGPFVLGALLGLFLTVFEALVFVGFPLAAAIAVVFFALRFALHFFQVCS